MAKRGRPPIYKTPEEMQKVIDEYFKSCEGEVLKDDNGHMVLDKWGMPVIIGQKPLTITGLALALGFNSRQALLNYQAKDEFNDTITRAKARIEQYAEERLYDKDGCNGAKFNLVNNFGWKDRQEIDQNIGNKDDKPFKQELSDEDKKLLERVAKRLMPDECS